MDLRLEATAAAGGDSRRRRGAAIRTRATATLKRRRSLLPPNRPAAHGKPKNQEGEKEKGLPLRRADGDFLGGLGYSSLCVVGGCALSRKVAGNHL